MKILPLKDAVERISAKTPIGSLLRSEEWERVPVALRERAQFSAGVTSVRLLQSIQDRLKAQIAVEKEKLSNGQEATFDRSSFIDAMRDVARSEGLEPESGKGGLTDITSIPRLGLIYDMQQQQAAGFARWKMDQSEGALLLWPAWEFVRVEERRVPREESDPGFWERRWVAAANAAGDADAVRVLRDTGRKVALKTSGIWSKLSRFGTPWMPFDWGSGMGVEEVEREDAVALGILREDQVLQSRERDFNDELQASVKGLSAPMKGVLQEHFGSQVAIDIAGDEVRWNSLASGEYEEELRRQRVTARETARQIRAGLELGRGVSEAEVVGGSVSEPGGATALGRQDAARARADGYTLNQAVAQASSVAAGRKPLYHEYYPSEAEAERVASILEKASKHLTVKVVGNQVFAWNPDKLRVSFDEILHELNSGRGGDLLGYGARGLRDRGTVLVRIVDDAGNLVAGFRAPRDNAVLFGAARARDFTEATKRMHRYEVVP